MIEILNRFLIQNRSISIPGLGTLHAERVPARLNQDATALLPPGFSFKFDKYFDAPDKAFFLYLSSQQHVPEYESMRLYNQFAQDFRAAILLEEKSEWPGIGHFQKNNAGEVEFVQTANDHSGYEQVEWKPMISSISSDAALEPVELETPGLPESETLTEVDKSITNSALPDQPEPLTANDTIQQEFEVSSDPVLSEEAVPTDTTPARSSGRILIRIGWGAVAAAAIALVIHFSQHGFNLKAAANQQSFQSSR